MISFARYTALLAIRELRAALAASLIGRLPVGITGLAILLLVRSSSGSFASAGAATACYTAGLATLAPITGRLIDRRGPRPVLLPCGVLNPISLVALVALIEVGAPAWGMVTICRDRGRELPTHYCMHAHAVPTPAR